MTTEIQETKNYDKFSFIESNRDYNRGHVERLKQAFEETGNLTKVQPILVNDKFEIIDGQHRFVACRDLGETIYYTMVPGLTVRDARQMNILHRRWTIDDYAKSYAMAGNPNYRKIIELQEDYGFNWGVIVIYSLGQAPSGFTKDFRNGDFVLPDEKAARERLDALADVGVYVPFVGDKSFTRAFLNILKVDGYDQKRMLRKLELHQSMLERRGDVQGYSRLLEEIYNFQMSETARLRLY